MKPQMEEKTTNTQEEIFSKALRAGRRTYFFDVRSTKANDFYLTITESKKEEGGNGDSFYRKHKIYLYKEDFERFGDIMQEMMKFIVDQKGEEVISERHNPEFKRNEFGTHDEEVTQGNYTDVNFDEI